MDAEQISAAGFRNILKSWKNTERIRWNRLEKFQVESAHNAAEKVSSDAKLCPQCTLLDQHLTEILETDLYVSHLFDIEPHAGERSTPCSLCNLFLQGPNIDGAVCGDPRSDGTTGLGLFAVNILSESEIHDAMEYPPKLYSMGLVTRPTKILTLTGGWSAESMLLGTPKAQHRYGSQRFVMPAFKNDAPAHDRTPYLARLLDPDKIDFSLVKFWISRCEQGHSKCHRQGEDVGEKIDVIDCHSSRIVARPQNAEYVALSYVWGPPSESQAGSEESSKNLSRAPRTVRDAMTITKKIGYQYLWVDKYCIDQSNEVKKLAHMSKMDLIYENAAITIAAAAGKDDGFGIPGAGTEPLVSRHRQLQVQMCSHTLVALDSDILGAVRASTWATRAWTFQEARLSKRCLIFTPIQAYFVCRTTHWCEALPVLPMLRSESKHGKVTLSNIFSFDTNYHGSHTEREPSQLETLQRDSNVYLQRILTYDSDAINAFRGFLSRSPFWSFYGVPLLTRPGHDLTKESVLSSEMDAHLQGDPSAPSPVLSFLDGLCWWAVWHKNSRQYEHRRRKQIPTWSWLSLCDGPISFASGDFNRAEQFPSPLDGYTNLDSEVQVYLQNSDSNAKQVHWDELETVWRNSKGKTITESGSLLKISTQMAEVCEVKGIVPSGDFRVQPRISFNSTGTNMQVGDANFDCHESLPLELGRNWSFPGLAWRLALIHRRSVDNQQNSETFELGKTESYCLILEPSGDYWKRVGIVRTFEDCMSNWERDTVIIC